MPRPTPLPPDRSPCGPASAPAVHVGIFDSGVGGLSILQALLHSCPGVRFSYVADTAYAPYGQRSAAEVLERSRRLAGRLLDEGAQAVVVACNTATTQAIQALRDTFPGRPFIGVEPGIKPAAQASANGRIGVMATPGTLASARFAELVRQHAQGCRVTAVPCPGLASAIEDGLPNPQVETLLDAFCAPLRRDAVDVVVLGCTHYPFVADRVAARLAPGVRLLDTADAVARRTREVLRLPDPGATAPACAHGSAAPPPTLFTTGDAAQLARQVRSLLGQAWPTQAIQL